MTVQSSPPTADGVPLLGVGPAFARNPITAMESWAEDGGIVELAIPRQSWYLVTDPEPIEEVLVEKHDRFSIGPAQRDTFEGVEDHAVTTATGAQWERLRRGLRPLFSRDRLERYTERTAARTASAVDRWRDGATVDLHREMRTLTVAALADALLDVDATGREHVLMDASDALLDRADFRRPGRMLPDWVPTPTDRRFARAVSELREFVDGVLDERRSSTRGDDAASLLLAAADRGDLSREEVRHNLVALLLAGHESPGLALTYAWFLLSEHPAVLDSVVAESCEIVDSKNVDGGAFDELERTRDVVAETLRLYPPTTGVNRQAVEPVTVGGYELPEGAQLLIPQWVPHRDERFWDDPAAFDPSRWREARDRPEYAYFPFGAGPRNCIGATFARRLVTLALATMVGRVDLDVSVETPLSFRPTIALRPEQRMRATVTRRT